MVFGVGKTALLCNGRSFMQIHCAERQRPRVAGQDLVRSYCGSRNSKATVALKLAASECRAELRLRSCLRPSQRLGDPLRHVHPRLISPTGQSYHLKNHLADIVAGYFRYYHRWRTHQSLEMDCPERREVLTFDCGQITLHALPTPLMHRLAVSPVTEEPFHLRSPWLPAHR